MVDPPAAERIMALHLDTRSLRNRDRLARPKLAALPGRIPNG